MKKHIHVIALVPILLCWAISACSISPSRSNQPAGPVVLVVESFLADIAQNIAGDRLTVETLIPTGVDPHAFEPSPRDVARIADSSLLIISGAGLEKWLQKTLDNAGGQHVVIEASKGLQGRAPREGEEAGHPDTTPQELAVDPHFWLDPLNVIRYVENIRDGLITMDPAGQDTYTRNAAAYILQLKQLDEDIRAQVEQIPPERRMIVTNHESLGYFADRYGLQIIGAVIPSVSSDASPSAQQLAHLIDRVRSTGVSAIFLEVGANSRLAEQIAAETDIKVVTGLNTESLTREDGPAPTYLEMMRENTRLIVEALR
jgi:ABC-type Zn uptake system ZnuABC Zn-binding protein ZnuA